MIVGRLCSTTLISNKTFAQWEDFYIGSRLLPRVLEEIQVVWVERGNEEEHAHFVAADESEEEGAERAS